MQEQVGRKYPILFQKIFGFPEWLLLDTKKSVFFVTLNGYRSDDFTPYIYVSEDYGQTWKSIAANIPTAAVNVIIEDDQ
jgi:hypothetical protein